MRHDGRTFLLGAEIFFGFADFRALEMTDFRSHFIDGAGDDSQGRYVFGMAVTLQGLGRNRRRSDAEVFADIFFNKGINVGIGTDSTGNLADGNRFLSMFHAVDVAFDFSHPVAQLEAERRGFGVDAMSTADARRVLKFNGTAAQYGMEVFQVLDEYIRSLFEHVAKSRIFDVCRSQAEVYIFAGFTDVFRKRRDESRNVMVCFRFDFMDTVDRKSSFFANFFSRFLGDVAQFGLCFTGQDFDLFHRIPFIVFCPNMTHFRFRIAFNHS